MSHKLNIHILEIKKNVDIKEKIFKTLHKKEFNIKVLSYENMHKEEYNLKDISLLLVLDNEDIKYNLNKFIQHNIPILKIIKNITQTLINKINKSYCTDFIKVSNIEDELQCRIKRQISYYKDMKLVSEEVFLNRQYKESIDKKDIVSKTNLKGIITYVNKNFENISGYSKSELIGKSHSLLKSPEYSKLFFKEMWIQISINKKPWRGIINNIAKDGTKYCVDTIINPIFDKEKNIIEYISIRNNVTDLYNSLSYFKSQFKIKSNNYKEVLYLSKIYEEAIEESSIIIRVNTKLTITYVNDSFSKLSGYTKEELIGQHYSFISNKNSKQILEIKNILNQGKIWKGKIVDVKKTGELLHFFTTIIPLKDKNGNIFEWIGIRYDLTELTNLHHEIKDTQRDILSKIGEIGESRSQETGNHVKRVAQYSKDLAKLYGLKESEIEALYMASPMHDIGKVGIPDNILNKPGKLTKEEYEIMKTHAQLGYNILKGSKREILQTAAIVAREHHEKWDGSGYPRGLKGKKIHIYGRITAIADVFDALGSNRVYKKAWLDEDIFNLLKNERGKHFDPSLIDLFLNNKEIFFKTRNQYVD
ncbi:MAG: PAS domain-containing protein [Campylobacterales bacterium]|nr:PAS domain-containing protein [Campylobacterales bacterium]